MNVAEQSWQAIRGAQARNAAEVEAVKARFPLADRTLPVMLRRQAEIHGPKLLFRCGGRDITFAEAPAIAARWAGMLAAAGVARGDRVALLCGNRAEFYPLFLGIAWLGAVAVPINTASRGFQLEHILANCGAKLLCIEDTSAAALDTIDRAETALEQVFVIGDPGETGLAPLPDPGDPQEPADLAPGDLLAILYTSGTTGPSKGVRCPHAQYFWWGVYVARQITTAPGDVMHTTLPLFHTNALGASFEALLMGATLVVEDRFSVSRFWDRLVTQKATVTFLLGAMVPMLLSRKPSEAERAHNVRCALAPGVPAHLHEGFTERTGIVLFDGYGATESNGVIGTDPDSYRPGSMGVLQDGFAARVADEHDQPVPDGTPGELLLRAEEPYAFADGYFGMPEKTAEAWRNLWLHTGDRVVREADGAYRFIDRMSDSIRRRGENISSFEVEKALTSHPAIGVAAVFAVDSELAEDEVMAVLTLKDDAAITEEEVIAWCETRMPYFAVPRYIEFVTDLPRTESGKVQKFKLRQQGVTAATWDREKAGVRVKR